MNLTLPEAWRYRDYIIDSFSKDKSYFQFIKEQIAGDLLPCQNNQQKAEQLIATAFLAIGPKGINDSNPRQFAVDLADEQIDSVSQAFMGMTIACARCHDHKFDPISQRDYTALAGIFLSTQTHYGTAGGVQGRNRSTLVELPANTGKIINKPISQEEIKQKSARLEKLRSESKAALASRAQGKSAEDGKTNFDIVRILTQSVTIENQLAHFDSQGNPKLLTMGVSEKPLTITATQRGPGRPNQGGGQATRPSPGQGQGQGPGQANNMPNNRRRSSGFEIIADSPFFKRGDIEQEESKVPRSLPTWFFSSSDISIPTNQSRRLQLANWLTDPQNPLTARVMVNRIWYWLMNRGIAEQLDYLGNMSSLPSNQELLDELSLRFIKNNGSIKSLISSIVKSKVYQLSNEHLDNSFEKDPDNQFFWRYTSKRLTAEGIRDSLLSITGTLDKRRPTASLVGYAQDGPIGGERIKVLTEEQIALYSSNHRSIYLPQVRNVSHSILGIFDMTDASMVQTIRSTTNVPAQALFLLNSSFVQQQAATLGSQLYQEYSANPSKGIEQAYLICFSRLPSALELKSNLEWIHSSGKTLKSWNSFVHILFASAEMRYIN